MSAPSRMRILLQQPKDDELRAKVGPGPRIVPFRILDQLDCRIVAPQAESRQWDELRRIEHCERTQRHRPIETVILPARGQTALPNATGQIRHKLGIVQPPAQNLCGGRGGATAQWPWSARQPAHHPAARSSPRRDRSKWPAVRRQTGRLRTAAADASDVATGVLDTRPISRPQNEDRRPRVVHHQQDPRLPQSGGNRVRDDVGMVSIQADLVFKPLISGMGGGFLKHSVPARKQRAATGRDDQ